MVKAMIARPPSFQPVKKPGSEAKGAPLLDPNGPEVVIGWQDNSPAIPNSPDKAVLFGSRGLCQCADGSFWVADTGHHRILGWNSLPTQDNQPADIVIGQPDFTSEGRNAKGEPHSASMNVPTGLSAWGDGLAVADAWNHRILLWKTRPTQNNQPADLILGQDDAHSISANHGKDAPNAASMHWPYGVAEIGGQLMVCDSANRRVMIWNGVTQNGQPADMILGQKNPDCRDENGGEAVSHFGMRWPHDVALWQGHLAVSDAGNNRVMLWKNWVENHGDFTNGQPCDIVLGQKNFSDCDHNMGNYYPSSDTLNMPYAIATCGNELIVADTACSRILGWQKANMTSAAERLAGQPDFASKGDNGWGMATRTSSCWPYGLNMAGDKLLIADSGNNRVMIWKVADYG